MRVSKHLEGTLGTRQTRKAGLQDYDDLPRRLIVNVGVDVRGFQYRLD